MGVAHDARCRAAVEHPLHTPSVRGCIALACGVSGPHRKVHTESVCVSRGEVSIEADGGDGTHVACGRTVPDHLLTAVIWVISGALLVKLRKRIVNKRNKGVHASSGNNRRE